MRLEEGSIVTSRVGPVAGLALSGARYGHGLSTSVISLIRLLPVGDSAGLVQSAPLGKNALGED